MEQIDAPMEEKHVPIGLVLLVIVMGLLAVAVLTAGALLLTRPELFTPVF
ncbi:MAG: hypothetical protein GYB64_08225 [Chloroflexi bacterium]|nr:hypothetical protein [Chloroflexota bacterium]